MIGGAIARIFLQAHFGTVILSSISQVGAVKAQQRLADQVEQLVSSGQKISSDQIITLEEKLASAEIHTLDADFARKAADMIKAARKDGDSLGAVVEVVAVNVPALVGDPLYQSLKIKLMAGKLGHPQSTAGRLFETTNDGNSESLPETM